VDRGTMLGFAVLDEDPKSGDVAVWLTSQVDTKAAGHTNAVIFPRAERDPAKVHAMVADRYVVVTARTVPHPVEMTGVHRNPADLQALQNEVAAAKQDLEEQFNAWQTSNPRQRTAVGPRWPIIPSARLALPDPSIDAAAVLTEANYLAAIWTAWLVLEAERVPRRFLNPQHASIRLIPPTFAGLYEPMPLPQAPR
jgi:hypothetical protein